MYIKIPIKNKMVSLTALSLGGIIMLPTRNISQILSE